MRVFSYAEPLPKVFTAWSERVLAFTLSNKIGVSRFRSLGNILAMTKRPSKGLRPMLPGWCLEQGAGPTRPFSRPRNEGGAIRSGQGEADAKVKDRDAAMVQRGACGGTLNELPRFQRAGTLQM